MADTSRDRVRPWLLPLARTPRTGEHEPMEEVQRLLDQLVAAGAPGAAAWIHDEHGSVQAASGVADLRARRPMRPGLHFRAGSLTKSLVATVVLQLVAEGRLSLSDTLERWLPAILPYGDRITIHQLLNHTSGVPDYWAAVEPDAVWVPAGTPPRVDPTSAGRPGGRPATGLAARHGLVVLQHRLRPARPDRGGGHRQHARSVNWSGASSGRLGCATPCYQATPLASRARRRAATASGSAHKGK